MIIPCGSMYVQISDEKEASGKKTDRAGAILQYVKTDVEQAHSARRIKTNSC